MTGNAGLFHIASEQTHRCWNVMPTVRNARGTDLCAALVNDEDSVTPIQSKALSKRAAVPLGHSMDRLASRWWVITVGATSHNAVCFVLTLEEVKWLASRDKGGSHAY